MFSRPKKGIPGTLVPSIFPSGFKTDISRLVTEKNGKTEGPNQGKLYANPQGRGGGGELFSLIAPRGGAVGGLGAHFRVEFEIRPPFLVTHI